jgi:hypothetical protein
MSKVSVWADEDLLEHLKQKIDALIISTRNVKSEKMIMNEKASRFKKLVTIDMPTLLSWIASRLFRGRSQD